MVGALRGLLKAVILCYAVVILGFVWVTKDLTFATLARDPLFASYSIAVVIYVLGRYALSLLYRPVPDRGFRPTVSIIIPAFNEQEGIIGTIASCIETDYPAHLSEVIAINDGSTDRTWERILEAKGRWPQLYAIHLGANYGKRGAMAEGIRRARGDVLVFVDSDPYLDADAVTAIVQPFTDQRVGAVVGHAQVRNASVNWMTKMQQVRYYSAFRVIKGTESMLSGTVTCASGCCAAYRRSVVVALLDEWEFQTFLGRPATLGDDRALTNRILARHRVVYQDSARAETVAPERPPGLLPPAAPVEEVVAAGVDAGGPLLLAEEPDRRHLHLRVDRLPVHGSVDGAPRCRRRGWWEGRPEASGSRSSAPTPWPCSTRSTTPAP